jgi:alpha-D-xyloside xylohydrolase
VDWYDFYTGERHRGGQTIMAAAPLDRIPLFAPAGGIIPLGKVMAHVGAEPDDVREVRVYPPAQGRAAFTLIEDDGVSMGYARGEFAALTLEVRATQDALRLEVQQDQQGYRLPYETLTVVLPPGETRKIHAYGGGLFTGADGVRRMTLRLA